jgi:hypothetical protein
MPAHSAFWPASPAAIRVTPLHGPRLAFHPKGLPPSIENWEVVAASIIRRVHREDADNPSGEMLKCLLEEFTQLSELAEPTGACSICMTPSPFPTSKYNCKNSTLRLFCALTTFGAAQDDAAGNSGLKVFPCR